MAIFFLKNSEIDLNAWDKCIAGSFNSSICAFSWFLDLICEDWGALVEDDYESVMPLILQRFLGKEIIGLPYFAYDLGIFSNHPITPDKTRVFIEAVPPVFSYYRIMLNKYNPLDCKGCTTILHKRFELDLILPYFKLTAGYTPDLSRRLNITMANGYYLSPGLSPNEMISLIDKNRIPAPRIIKKHNYRLLRTVMAGLIQHNSGELYGLFDRYNEISSVALVAWMNNRINLVFQATAPDKIKDFPDLFLIDRIIDKYSETNTTLLFDSGFIMNYPVLFKEFGARETTSIEVFKNKLTFPCNLLIHYRIFNTCLSSSQYSSN